MPKPKPKPNPNLNPNPNPDPNQARELGLCPARLGARAATLEAADLLAYDLIVAVDFTVLEQVP